MGYFEEFLVNRASKQASLKGLFNAGNGYTKLKPIVGSVKNKLMPSISAGSVGSVKKSIGLSTGIENLGKKVTTSAPKQNPATTPGAAPVVQPPVKAKSNTVTPPASGSKKPSLKERLASAEAKSKEVKTVVQPAPTPPPTVQPAPTTATTSASKIPSIKPNRFDFTGKLNNQATPPPTVQPAPTPTAPPVTQPAPSAGLPPPVTNQATVAPAPATTTETKPTKNKKPTLKERLAAAEAKNNAPQDTRQTTSTVVEPQTQKSPSSGWKWGVGLAGATGAAGFTLGNMERDGRRYEQQR